MRVVAGKYKGFNLKPPKEKSSRPTDNKVKEAIFDMLYPLKNNCVALDLFAGTGQMGIEFLSRGANLVYFNERNFSTYNILNENLNKIDSYDVKVSKLDFKKALSEYKENNIRFDYMFLDPPYTGESLTQAIELVVKYDLLNEEGIIVTESDRDLDFSYIESLERIKEKSYGRKIVKFYIKNEGNISR